VKGTILVSGGSGGIGAATCHLLASRGWRPLVGYASQETSARAIAEATGGEAIKLDLSDEADIDQFIRFATRLGSRLAGVVLAASPRPTLAPFEKISTADMASQWQINVSGPQKLIAGLIGECFRRERKGSIVGLTSRVVEDPAAARHFGAYSIAKNGMTGMLKLLAAEYPWLNVKIISPGLTETPMLECFHPRQLDLMRTAAPNGRFAAPEDVAREVIASIEME
jgi:NAD(P)-dependent dehydrogenase (short-subunit alcohol dehydrogenase family)